MVSGGLLIVVFLIMAALVMLIGEVFVAISSAREINCPVCGKRFDDIFDLHGHMRRGEKAT